MFVTHYDEVELAQRVSARQLNPVLSSDRRLIQAYRGRFCFDIGVAARCIDTTITLTQGETHTLKLSLSKIGSLGIERQHKIERTVTYVVGDCDSVDPKVCYDDAEVDIYELSANLAGIHLAANEVMFVPGPGRPFITANKVVDDPDCGCSKGPGSGDGDDRISLELDRFLIRLLTTTHLQPARIDEPVSASDEIAASAVAMLERMMRPVQPDVREAVGVTDIHGKTNWFVGPFVAERLQLLSLISHDANAPVRGELLVPVGESEFDVLLVSPVRYAATGTVRLLIDERGRMVDYASSELTIRADLATAAHTRLDFSDFANGAHGELHMQLWNQDGDPVTEPLIEPFNVVTQPIAASTPQPA